MRDSSTLLLQANNISIVFGGLRAVSDFNCELHAGELVGLIGPNGAGKTTVFNMLSGIMNAVGNSKRTLIYLSVTSILNILLELLLKRI